MASIKDQAIALRRLDYSETSQVLVFFTREHGLRRLIAKGVKRSTKKKFATGIDLLERGRVVFIARSEGAEGLATLTEWQQTDAHLGLRGELQRLYAAQYAAQITSAMTEEADPHPDLFDALAELLASLAAGGPTGGAPRPPGGPPPPEVGDTIDPSRDREGADTPELSPTTAPSRSRLGSGSSGDPMALPLVVGYQCALLTAVGLWPDLTRCVVCDKPAPPARGAYFSAHQGGLICRDCQGPLPEKRRVSAAVLTALRQRNCPPGVAAAAFDLLNYTIAHVLGRPPSLARFLLSS